ncbi:unnamed protein product [Penicillium camemberti]|uniref:Str. FM013 n=1 Tax=Penicillium camemberti (strain FM 013) TaxID=1429867 RepID=A0A0G4P047_PENC3|nr:unnamed protein product [Penicillium camemberti]
MLGFLKRALRKPHTNVYGLDHAVLNIQLTQQSMWMNTLVKAAAANIGKPHPAEEKWYV